MAQHEMKRQIRLIRLISLIGLMGQIFCQVIMAEEISLTLDDAVALALRDNRDILLKTEDVKRAQAELAESKGALFPTLNFTASRINTMGLYAKDIPSTTTQAALKQYLYKGGKTVNSISRDKYELIAKEAVVDTTRLETILSVKKAFYTLLLAGDLVDLNKAILENTKMHLDTAHKRYENGQVPQRDIIKLESSLSNVWQAFEASLNQAASGQALLNNLLYLGEEVRIRPDGQFIYEPAEVEFDKAFLKAMSSRPEIRQYEAEINADKKSIEIAKADNRPNIYASWDYYSRSTTSLTFSPSKAWQDYQIAGVTFSWPIFDGWQTKAKVEQAIVDLKQTQLTKEKTMKDIAQELKNAYLDLKNSIEKIMAVQSELPLYKDLFFAAEEKYKAGIASSLELNDASLAYRVSLFNQTQAIYDYLTAKAGFEKAMGGKG